MSYAYQQGREVLHGINLTIAPGERLAVKTTCSSARSGNNITLARADASDRAARAALATVDALDWALALPQGLDTEVGAGRHALTPDRAQQVALARLVLADPHVLVLDEATALIDPAAAHHLERSLAAALKGRTVIAIAHRLFSAHDADRVAVVDGGRITELGSHDELIAANGAYAALWRSWQDVNQRCD